MNCPACDNTTDKTIEAECYPADVALFGHACIVRSTCDNCGLIWGPQSFIDLSVEELNKKYTEIYKVVSDTYTTVDYHNFFHLNPSLNGNYLNIACGTQAHYLNNLHYVGYKIYTNEILLPQDDYNSHSLNDCPIQVFDGIFSNNYIEHIQHPVDWFSDLNKRLVANGAMIHSTGCFNYTIERTPFHLYFWNTKALESLCKKTGFILESVMKYHVPISKYLSLDLNSIHNVQYGNENLRGDEGVRLVFRKT